MEEYDKYNEENERKRKAIVPLLIGVLTLTALVVGAIYATETPVTIGSTTSLSCTATNEPLKDYTVGYFSTSQSGTKYTDYTQALYYRYLTLRSETLSSNPTYACELLNNHLVCVQNNSYSNDDLGNQCAAIGGTYSDNNIYKKCAVQSQSCYVNFNGSATCETLFNYCYVSADGNSECGAW